MSNGFSLLEVLISILIVGVGLLGLGGLQVVSMKVTNNAHSRNIATQLAMELSEKMRVNKLGVEGGFYENDVSCSTTITDCTSGTSCSPKNIAQQDIQEIMCGIPTGNDDEREGGILNSLQSGSLLVEHNVDCDPNITNEHETRISISWLVLDEHKDQTKENSDTTLSTCIVPY